MMAANLVKRGVNVIAATGGEQSALASKEMIQSIPIVFIAGSDPVRQGLVASLNRPGENLTGTFFLTGAIESKRLGLLRKLVPNAAVIGVLLNPNSPAAELQHVILIDARCKLSECVRVDHDGAGWCDAGRSPMRMRRATSRALQRQRKRDSRYN